MVFPSENANSEISLKNEMLPKLYQATFQKQKSSRKIPYFSKNVKHLTTWLDFSLLNSLQIWSWLQLIKSTGIKTS